MAKFSFSRSKEAAIDNIKGYLTVSLALALIAAILRSLAYLFSFDADIGYFNGSFFSKIATYFIVVACGFALTGFVFISKEADLPRKLTNEGNSIYFASVFAGFIMIADFAFKLYLMIGEDKFSYYKFIFARTFKSENSYIIRATAVIEIAGVVASLLAAVCFFLRSSKKFNSKLCAWLGFFPIIRALTGVAQIYFEMEVQMNHPSKLMLEFALIAVMIAFLYELRFFISEDHARPRHFVVLACVALIISISAGISEMIGFFAGKLTKGDFCIEAFFCLAMGLYGAARTISYVKSLETKVPDQVVEE